MATFFLKDADDPNDAGDPDGAAVMHDARSTLPRIYSAEILASRFRRSSSFALDGEGRAQRRTLVSDLFVVPDDGAGEAGPADVGDVLPRRTQRRASTVRRGSNAARVHALVSSGPQNLFGPLMRQFSVTSIGDASPNPSLHNARRAGAALDPGRLPPALEESPMVESHRPVRVPSAFDLEQPAPMMVTLPTRDDGSPHSQSQPQSPIDSGPFVRVHPAPPSVSRRPSLLAARSPRASGGAFSAPAGRIALTGGGYDAPDSPATAARKPQTFSSPLEEIAAGVVG